MATESRPKRWAAAVAKAKATLSAMQDQHEQLKSDLEAIRDVRGEYEEWRGNLPENLEGSTLAEKLDEVIALDLDEEDDLDTIETTLDEAENIDLPRGFGRD